MYEKSIDAVYFPCRRSTQACQERADRRMDERPGGAWAPCGTRCRIKAFDFLNIAPAKNGPHLPVTFPGSGTSSSEGPQMSEGIYDVCVGRGPVVVITRASFLQVARQLLYQ